MTDSEEFNQKLLNGESGAVTTYCRFRPFIKAEVPDSDSSLKKTQCSVAFHKKGKSVLLKYGVERPIKFDFERVFPMSASQELIYQHVGRQCVAEVMHLNNVVVLFCGAESTGKSYTLLGSADWSDVCRLT